MTGIQDCEEVRMQRLRTGDKEQQRRIYRRAGQEETMGSVASSIKMHRLLPRPASLHLAITPHPRAPRADSANGILKNKLPIEDAVYRGVIAGLSSGICSARQLLEIAHSIFPPRAFHRSIMDSSSFFSDSYVSISVP